MGLSVFVMPVPSSLKNPIDCRVFGVKVGEDVRIGLAWMQVNRLEIADHVPIGQLTRIKGIPMVQIGDHASLGPANTFTVTYEFTNERTQAERG